MTSSTPNPAPLLSFGERHAENLAEFSDRLGQSRLWHLLPEGENDPAKASGLFDTQSGLIYPPAAQLRAFLDQHPFVFVVTDKDAQALGTLQSMTRLLWNNEASHDDYSLEDGKKLVEAGRWAGLEGWRLPSMDMLRTFATGSFNPHRKGKDYRLATEGKPSPIAHDGPWSNNFGKLQRAAAIGGDEDHLWLTIEGQCDVDKGYWEVKPYGPGCIFAVHLLWVTASDAQLLADLASCGWRLVAPQGEAFGPDPRWQGRSMEKLLASCVLERVSFKAIGQDSLTLDPGSLWIDRQLAELDYRPCRLPRLDDTQLTDPEKGLWELWGEEPALLARFGLIARDPGNDVQRRAVAIDFGTSSTVVAMDTANGGRELLRIGVRDFYQKVEAQHFENPTVLECLDFTAFEAAWTARAYRPELDWNWMRAAHEAQASFRDNPGETGVLASMLPKLKQWALRSGQARVRLTDRQGREIELALHTERNPVRGQALGVAAEDPFDPIELYAWYLGMAINWRGRGLFLKYYLSFPVKYSREVKDRILASFRRGLQRSLPYALIEHHPQVLNEFEVSDLASEPAAYAAAALPQLGIAPTEDGVPYAVFDFGGGTTDFDFGLLRWATPNEEMQGYEQVFEHLASGGDKYLGGENLLEQLVYASFQHNLEELRKHRIQFTLPLETLLFAGSEAFLAQTQAAQTNTVMLAARLRDFLEGDRSTLPTQLKLDLFDADGKKKACELTLDAEALDALLAGRMREGAQAFVAELTRLSAELPPGAPIHVLLAGNGSRSRHIRMLFDTEDEPWHDLLEQAFGEAPPKIIVHPPLPVNESNPHAPTAKTGVALGLLRLVPGENTLLLNHLHIRHEGQAPFGWFAGRLRRGRFEPTLAPGVTYGTWHDLGPLQQGVFNLFTTASPRAHLGLPEGDPQLTKHRLDFPAAPVGARLFTRAVAPHRLELVASLDAPSPQDGPALPLNLE